MKSLINGGQQFHQITKTYDVGNLGQGLSQTEKCDGVIIICKFSIDLYRACNEKNDVL